MNRMIAASALLATALVGPWASQAQAAQPAPEADEIANEQMVSFYEQGAIGKQVWVVDSRPTPKYISGHIPGASNLPLDVLKKDFANGYADAWVYRNGVPGWNQKAQPLQAEAALLQKGNLILLDTAAGQPTIVTPNNQTLQMSLEALQAEQGQKLLAGLSRNAPLVVLDRGDMNAVNAALEALRDLDFRRIAYFPLGAWKAPLAAAPALTTVSWAPVYAPGQVSPKAFEEAVASGKFILDVRPAADFARGHFKGAVNLPIEDMERDYAQLPKDVPIFVNCATGAKSQKTFDILGRKGYANVAYLDAEIACKGETCSIKE